MTSREDISHRLATLKAEFDASFARPALRAEARWEVLLRLRVGGSPLAVSLERLAGVHALPRVVALPGSPPGLLGVAGLRGQLVAVHDLAANLGLPSDENPGWLLLCDKDRHLGLAVGGFEGQLRVAPEQLLPCTDSAPRPFLNSTVLRPGEAPLPVLDISSLADALLDGASAPRASR
ncbi:chemotaxis protein CheW [Hyalangium versicolor]|uniref:chemotaxis protein CheW n=1 Tax=Hyalangium versicolor TaxID=2861190 RepID=UPI001CCB7A10|nr:chemotaxis protein CheW [Hyalangium versicolor]